MYGLFANELAPLVYMRNNLLESLVLAMFVFTLFSGLVFSVDAGAGACVCARRALAHSRVHTRVLHAHVRALASRTPAAASGASPLALILLVALVSTTLFLTHGVVQGARAARAANVALSRANARYPQLAEA